MGYFSWNCSCCGRSLRPVEATNDVSRWMSNVIILKQPLPNSSVEHGRLSGDKVTGQYDGYGRVTSTQGHEHSFDGREFDGFEAYHEKCYNLAGKPAWNKPATAAIDQGYFAEGDPSEPQTLEECVASLNEPQRHLVLSSLQKLTNKDRLESLPNNNGTTFKVGDGVHWGFNGDAYPGTVRRVSKSGRKVWVTRDAYRVVRRQPYQEGPIDCVFIPIQDPKDDDIEEYTLRKSGYFHKKGNYRGGGWSLQPERIYAQNPHF